MKPKLDWKCRASPIHGLQPQEDPSQRFHVWSVFRKEIPSSNHFLPIPFTCLQDTNDATIPSPMWDLLLWKQFCVTSSQP